MGEVFSFGEAKARRDERNARFQPAFSADEGPSHIDEEAILAEDIRRRIVALEFLEYALAVNDEDMQSAGAGQDSETAADKGAVIATLLVRVNAGDAELIAALVHKSGTYMLPENEETGRPEFNKDYIREWLVLQHEALANPEKQRRISDALDFLDFVTMVSGSQNYGSPLGGNRWPRDSEMLELYDQVATGDEDVIHEVEVAAELARAHKSQGSDGNTPYDIEFCVGWLQSRRSRRSGSDGQQV